VWVMSKKRANCRGDDRIHLVRINHLRHSKMRTALSDRRPHREQSGHRKAGPSQRFALTMAAKTMASARGATGELRPLCLLDVIGETSSG
jgi:hypothetical protein